MRILSLTVLATMFALAGCATTDERSTLAAMPGKIVVDSEKVGLVNHTARMRGVRVIWVNPPTRRDAVASG